MTRLEIRPFSDEFLAPRGRAARRAPPRSPRGRAAAPGAGTRSAEARSCRGGGALADRGRLGRRRASRRARRRLPARRAQARRDLGRERLGRDRRACGRGAPRICATCTRRRPRGGSRRAATATTRSSRRRIRALLEAWSRVELRAAARVRDPRGARGRRGPRASGSRGGARHRRAGRARRRCFQTIRRWRRSSAAGLAAETEEELRAEHPGGPRQGRDRRPRRRAGRPDRRRVPDRRRSSCRACTSGLARPDGAALLGWAATRPDVRGSGAGAGA